MLLTVCLSLEIQPVRRLHGTVHRAADCQPRGVGRCGGALTVLNVSGILRDIHCSAVYCCAAQPLYTGDELYSTVKLALYFL